MKSIRLSLILYFLVLVGAALGTIGFLVYQLAEQALHAEEEAKEEKLQLTYDQRCRQEQDRMDQALAVQVRALADRTLLQSQYWNLAPLYRFVSAFGLVGAGAGPNGHVGTHLWSGMAVGRDWSRQPLYPSGRMVPPNIQLPQESLPPLPLGSTEYFQINSTWNQVILADSLGEVPLPFDARQFAQLDGFAMKFDEFDLEPGRHIRRATLKTPLTRYAPFPFRPPPKPPVGRPMGKRGGFAGPFEQPKRDNRGLTTPAPERPLESRFIYFQYASDTTERDRAIAELDAELRHKRAEHNTESAAALASMRNRLLGLSLVTFALTVLGCLSLVRHGLAPLRRVSEAVSRVSETDTRLQLDESRLPRELRPIVERLQQALDMLGRAYAREKQAAADISHELRTPLAALLTTTEVALRKSRSPEEYREVIADCRASCQQMSRLVERLLALSRLDAGVDRVRTEDVDAADLAEQCAGLVRPLAEARGLSLRVHRSGFTVATLDTDKVREILTNLLHNAIEYNQPRGSVDVAVARENGHVTLEVRDTGMGIACEAQRHIFERFFRADESRHAETMHAGLGLAIVKGYVDLMGGTISVRSSPGEGSTFRVQLPVRPYTVNGPRGVDA